MGAWCRNNGELVMAKVKVTALPEATEDKVFRLGILADVDRLLAYGYTQDEVAERIELLHGEAGKEQVDKSLSNLQVRGGYTAAGIANPERRHNNIERRSELRQRLRYVYREALEAWERSKKPLVKQVVNYLTGEINTLTSERDPVHQFLATALSALDREIKMDGLDAPLQSESEVKVSLDFDSLLAKPRQVTTESPSIRGAVSPGAPVGNSSSVDEIEAELAYLRSLPPAGDQP